MLWNILLLAALGGLPEAAAAGDRRFVDTQMGPVELADEASGKAFVLGAGGHEPESRFGVTTFRYLNTSKTEALDLVMHPGGARYAFMQFRVGRAGGPEMQRMATIGLDTFRSGAACTLGCGFRRSSVSSVNLRSKGLTVQTRPLSIVAARATPALY